MRNVWRSFQDLIPSQRRVYAEIVQVRGDGTSIVRTSEGRQWRVQGDGIPVGSFAYVTGTKIDGPAPALPTVNQEV